eukprot:CAMPEP_0197687402 /NCGR_PEP_ID=MMETSP1338-20131121/103922_1 /TAXON_ID=43686 ORGANISM="Pelagodinium beii, Strain RCC1491" /NCGR_SAMPLE_ID=MMETSP1338 /ASSEMBLY_ACC=CAM_ASM_000754 /LENGTH=103 /DNA_ID=CAMNT_0043269485 /DNA_START=200 /DNA_END=510 /DNA_ORIENTATION=+
MNVHLRILPAILGGIVMQQHPQAPSVLQWMLLQARATRQRACLISIACAAASVASWPEPEAVEAVTPATMLEAAAHPPPYISQAEVAWILQLALPYNVRIRDH